MYPNPQDVRPLPPHPNLDQYRKQAKDLVKASTSDDPSALRAWISRWLDARGDEVERFVRGHMREHKATGAQFVIARAHGFLSWPKFAAHLEGLRRASPVSNFEAAADAIVAGEEATLTRLLREHPDLIRARSTREHRATLLIYVAANGVENYRQTTPKNVVRIAGMLLDAGAAVDAEADVYGGGCTTLGLVATSVHPERAGVQNALMQLLIDRGAAIDHPAAAGNRHSIVNGCRANGRLAAALYLAAHGARLDLEGAAGIGRLDIVREFFNDDGSLKPTATQAQMHDGFAWATTNGQTAVVEYLLDRGMPTDARLRPHAQTGLHGAAHGGCVETVRLLLTRGASLDAKDESFAGTPLDWALHGWSQARKEPARDRYYEIVALLVRAGVPGPRTRDDVKDAQMIAALRGELPA
jgi:Ankyrin repeats (3 copies)